MKITVITLFPKMISGFFEESIIRRAVEKKLAEVEIINLRDFAVDDYGAVDDRPYGGGAGMVLRVDVIDAALSAVRKKLSGNLTGKTILTSPKGRRFDQSKAQELSKLDSLVIFAGHYEGIDERARDYFDEEVSLGDFVMTGGEITAAAVCDAVIRLVPGVLKKTDAVSNESFNIGGKKLLEYPHYTRPADYKGKKVPDTLTGGDHKKIEEWKSEKAVEETRKKRPDLL